MHVQAFNDPPVQMFCTNRQRYLNSEQISPPWHNFMYGNIIVDPLHSLLHTRCWLVVRFTLWPLYTQERTQYELKRSFLAWLHALKTSTFVFLCNAEWSWISSCSYWQQEFVLKKFHYRSWKQASCTPPSCVRQRHGSNDSMFHITISLLWTSRAKWNALYCGVTHGLHDCPLFIIAAEAMGSL